MLCTFDQKARRLVMDAAQNCPLVLHPVRPVLAWNGVERGIQYLRRKPFAEIDTECDELSTARLPRGARRQVLRDVRAPVRPRWVERDGAHDNPETMHG